MNSSRDECVKQEKANNSDRWPDDSGGLWAFGQCLCLVELGDGHKHAIGFDLLAFREEPEPLLHNNSANCAIFIAFSDQAAHEGSERRVLPYFRGHLRSQSLVYNLQFLTFRSYKRRRTKKIFAFHRNLIVYSLLINKGIILSMSVT